ncbi:MAG TPA: hypothetical protein PLS05_07605 [Clostridia bacterium]|nr:hypothetical protein [Clostridia bacterium]HOL61710.1 hypothetical protein [Clostridia bacterium]HPO54335.1 hypothetical protein [Clostridia bacterium]
MKSIEIINKTKELEVKNKEVDNKNIEIEKKNKEIIDKSIQIESILNSRSYKVGRAITWLPRVIKQSFLRKGERRLKKSGAKG